MNVIQDIPAEVIAAQFAGGMTIHRLAIEWDLDEAAVELAVRSQFRMLIPRWAGGDKPTRDAMRRQRRMDPEQAAATPWLIEPLGYQQ